MEHMPQDSLTLKKLFDVPLEFGGGFTLPSRVILSPMEGVMGREYLCRAAVEMNLIDLVMPPFIPLNDQSAPARSVFSRKLAFYMSLKLPLIAQLLGKDVPTLADSASVLNDIGIKAVNINLACPSRSVTSSGRGGAILSTPTHIYKICKEIRKRVPGMNLSLKLRTGFKSASETTAIMKAVTDAGCDFVIMHHRTVAEGYSKVERQDALDRISRTVQAAGNIPVFGNGDIETVEDAMRMKTECGCAGAALARVFLRDPFIMRRIKGNDEGGDETSAVEFLRRMLLCSDSSGEKHTADWIRNSFIECAAMSLGRDSELFRKLAKADEREIRDFFKIR